MAVSVSKLLSDAAKHLGKKYVFGAAGPNAFDCSGLTQYVFKQQGVNLPHHAEDQAKMGMAVSKNDIQPGDLVFSNWGDGPNSHVGIATGPHTIINAPHTGAVVRYQNLTSSYLAHVTAVRRISNDGGTGVVGVVTGAVGDAFGGLTSAIKDAAAPLVAIGEVSDGIMKLFMPSNFIRLVSGAFGFVFIAWGVLLLAKEVRNG
jgi:NlpC/P60 family